MFKQCLRQSAALALAALVLAGCQTVQTTQSGMVGVDRKQTFLVSSETVNSSSAKAYREVLQQASGKRQLNRDPAQVARVRAIAERLIRSTGAFRSDAPGWTWEVSVITSKEVNAWCMPGGKIAVYTGLIDRLKVTDDELAAVMGHEIAHALREHGRERASQQLVQGLAIGIIGIAAGLSRDTMDLSQTILDVTFNLPHSRTDETEADRIGVELAARSGYDPRAAISLWNKMIQAGGGQPPEWLSTHPSHERRVNDLQVYAARVMPLFESARQR